MKDSRFLLFSLLTILTIAFFTPLSAYRDGAREESCYDHLVNHPDSFTLDCVPGICRYFLVIKEVVNEKTLELGDETVNSYECGKIYGSKFCHA